MIVCDILFQEVEDILLRFREAGMLTGLSDSKVTGPFLTVTAAAHPNSDHGTIVVLIYF